MYIPFAVWMLAAAAAGVSGALVNRTIDDQYGDEITGLQVLYTPAGSWTQGNGCVYCAAHPNSSAAYDGTWHDSSYTPSRGDEPLTFVLTFNGTAIYIYNILPRLTLTDVNITVDGNFVTNFVHFHNVSIEEQFTYGFPIFALDSIPYAEHTVNVTTVGTNTSLLLFDYAVYTTNTSASDPLPQPQGGNDDQSGGSKKINVGAIVGGVVGGVVLLLICLVVGLLYRRRRMHANRAMAEAVTPEPFSASLPAASPGSPPSEMFTVTATGDSYQQSEKPSVIAIGNPAPSLPDDLTYIDRASSTANETSSAAALQDQLQFFRSELAALRAKSPPTSPKAVINTPSPGAVTGTPSSDSSDSANSGKQLQSAQAISSLENQIVLLRAQMTQLQAQQTVPSPTLSTPGSDDMQREINLLRGEIEELRLQHFDPLPAYSPPPPAPAASSRRLPAAP